MGGAVAAGLVSTVPAGGLVLESAFTSLEEMARSVYPVLPAFLFRRLKGRFATIDRVRNYRGPLLVVHGNQDELVPVGMGHELHDAGPEGSEWLGVPGAHHNDVSLVGGIDYLRRLAGFAQRAAARQDTGTDS